MCHSSIEYVVDHSAYPIMQLEMSKIPGSFNSINLLPKNINQEAKVIYFDTSDDAKKQFDFNISHLYSRPWKNIPVKSQFMSPSPDPLAIALMEEE